MPLGMGMQDMVLRVVVVVMCFCVCGRHISHQPQQHKLRNEAKSKTSAIYSHSHVTQELFENFHLETEEQTNKMSFH